jgi:hypothetical protein
MIIHGTSRRQMKCRWYGHDAIDACAEELLVWTFSIRPRSSAIEFFLIPTAE